MQQHAIKMYARSVIVFQRAIKTGLLLGESVSFQSSDEGVSLSYVLLMVLRFGSIQSGISDLHDRFDSVDVRTCIADGPSVRQDCAAGSNSQRDLLSGRDFRVSRQSQDPRMQYVNALKPRLSIPRSGVMTCRFRPRKRELFPSTSILYIRRQRLTHSFSLHNSIPSYSCNFCNNRAGSPRRLFEEAFFAINEIVYQQIVEKISVRDSL